MAFIVSEELEAYARACTSGMHPVYERLREVTFSGEIPRPQMQVGPLEGSLLRLLVRLSGARRALEVGTFTGYSALCIAEGLPEGGELVTIDRDASVAEVARRFFAEVPWGARIELRVGDARALVPAVEGPLDFAFIDADKAGYAAYWDAIVPKLSVGGLVVVDNVLWSGRVLDPAAPDDHAIVDFNDKAVADPRVECVLLTVRDGMLLARRVA